MITLEQEKDQKHTENEKVEEEEKVELREVKKRRGVGYTSQGGPLWDVNQYMKSKEESNEQIMQVFKMVRYFIKCEALT